MGRTTELAASVGPLTCTLSLPVSATKMFPVSSSTSSPWGLLNFPGAPPWPPIVLRKVISG